MGKSVLQRRLQKGWQKGWQEGWQKDLQGGFRDAASPRFDVVLFSPPH